MSLSDAPPSADAADAPLLEAVRCAHLAMIISDARTPDQPIVFANDAFLRLSGYAREEVIGRNCRFLQGPETDPAAVQAVREAVAAGEDVSVEILNYRKDGSTFWNALHISPVRMQDGELRHFFGSQVDISAKKASEFRRRHEAADLERAVAARTHDLQHALEQKTVLLHEVDHRVKNNLQLISALMLLRARRAEDPAVRTALERMLERLNAISTVHRRLFQSDDAASFDLAEFVRDLAGDLGGASGREDIEVRLSLEPVTVRADQAASVALMLNEVVTNALRHGFPEGRGGVVDITIARDEARCRISIVDDGVGREGGLPGFGGTIVDLLGRQLKATVRHEDGPPGTGVHIELPVDG